MHSLHDVFAVLVSANQFQLIDPITGEIAAELGVGTGTFGSFSSVTTFDELVMHHRDVLTTDSTLRWSYTNAGAPGVELVALMGPVQAPGGDARPALAFRTDPAGPTVNTVILEAGHPSGVMSGIGAQLSLQKIGTAGGGLNLSQANLTADSIQLATGGGSPRLVDNAFNLRGLLYGARFFSALLAANQLIGLANVTILTINTGTFPTAGGVLDISFYVNYVPQVAGGGITAQVFLGAAASLPIAVSSGGAIGTQQSISARHLNIGFAAGAPAQVVNLVVVSNAAGGAQCTGGNQCGLQVVQYD